MHFYNIKYAYWKKMFKTFLNGVLVLKYSVDPTFKYLKTISSNVL